MLCLRCLRYWRPGETFCGCGRVVQGITEEVKKQGEQRISSRFTVTPAIVLRSEGFPSVSFFLFHFSIFSSFFHFFHFSIFHFLHFFIFQFSFFHFFNFCIFFTFFIFLHVSSFFFFFLFSFFFLHFSSWRTGVRGSLPFFFLPLFFFSIFSSFFCHPLPHP